MIKYKPSLSLNTCLYVLTQTFRIVKNPEFTNLLFAALFLPNIPQVIQQSIDLIPKNPSTYSSKFKNNHLNTFSLSQYVEEYYNMNNMDVFLLHGSQNFEFLREIKQEYEQKIINQISLSTQKQQNSP